MLLSSSKTRVMCLLHWGRMQAAFFNAFAVCAMSCLGYNNFVVVVLYIHSPGRPASPPTKICPIFLFEVVQWKWVQLCVLSLMPLSDGRLYVGMGVS